MSTQSSKTKARKPESEQLDKFEKRIISEELKNIKPGECNKVIDLPALSVLVNIIIQFGIYAVRSCNN